MLGMRPNGQEYFDSPKTGEIALTSVSQQLPNISCYQVKFKARAINAVPVYIGPSGTTIGDGSTDATTGFELSAKEETGFVPVRNLNEFYALASAGVGQLTYLALE